jgi:hypothetical protein
LNNGAGGPTLLCFSADPDDDTAFFAADAVFPHATAPPAKKSKVDPDAEKGYLRAAMAGGAGALPGGEGYMGNAAAAAVPVAAGPATAAGCPAAHSVAAGPAAAADTGFPAAATGSPAASPPAKKPKVHLWGVGEGYAIGAGGPGALLGWDAFRAAQVGCCKLKWLKP